MWRSHVCVKKKKRNEKFIHNTTYYGFIGFLLAHLAFCLRCSNFITSIFMVFLSHADLCVFISRKQKKGLQSYRRINTFMFVSLTILVAVFFVLLNFHTQSRDLCIINAFKKKRNKHWTVVRMALQCIEATETMLNNRWIFSKRKFLERIMSVILWM